MYYYIEISSWNLLESFVTESISPFSFYSERNFGNNLSRYLSGEKEKSNYLILSTQDFGGDITLMIDESLIDKAYLSPIKKFSVNPVFTYPKTIYYKKGLVKIRFGSTTLRDSLIAESQILLEVKCLDKYIPYFYVKSKSIEKKSTITNLKEESFLLERQSFIEFDNAYNKIKGAIIGFVRGQYTSSDETNMKLRNELRDLKNSFGGMNTQIMMSDSYIEYPDLHDKIDLCKKLYFSTIGETNSFDVIVAQYNEVLKYAKLRSDDICGQESSFSIKRKEELLNERTEIENAIIQLEYSCQIHEAKKELEIIKFKEKANGEKEGRTRSYFKKGSKEYERKRELRDIIRGFEQENADYIQLKKRLYQLDEEISNDTNKYDAIISAIFIRISDILNDVIRNSSNLSGKGVIDLSVVNVDSEEIYIDNTSENPEKSYFNILLKCIIDNTSKRQISEYYAIKILEESAKQFKNAPISRSVTGEKILNTLRTYWAYKNQRAEEFSIPNDTPVLQSIMAFFIKPLGFEQIERYMLMKNFQQKSYAFMLWGAWVGFADMPKTFTNVLYQNEEANSLTENLFESILKELE